MRKGIRRAAVIDWAASAYAGGRFIRSSHGQTERENSMRILFAILLASGITACATTSTSTPSVATATEAWRTAYNSRDPARITAMYDTDAVLWGTTAKTIAPTPEAIYDYFKDAAKRPNARVTFGEQHLRVYGDIAVSTGYCTFPDLRDAREISQPARYSMTFRNKGGKWLIVAHHSSEIP